MSVSSGYWPPAENGNATPTFGEKDNVFYERVVNYSPVTKVKQMIEPLSPVAMSPGPASPYQTVMWTEPHQFVQEIQPPHSPGPYTQSSTIRRYIVQNAEPEVSIPSQQNTIRRYIVQNPEQEVSIPSQQNTIRRYIVQNPEQEVSIPSQQNTIRRYIVQNPEQEVSIPSQQNTIRRYIVQNPEQTQFLKGMNFVPGNNVIYEKTITRLEAPNSEQEKQTIIRSMSTVSMNDVNEQQVNQQVNQEINQNITQQVNQQINQRKISVQSSDQGSVFEHNIERKGSSQSFDQKSEQDFGPDKMDSRYFGELLAELSRKNNDLYSCLLQHVEKIGGRRHSSSSSDSQTEDIESLIPKGVSELTKQQIRYLLQMRQTSDKSMRLVLSTFNTLREDLGRLQGDLSKLENDKGLLESDLAFKESQVKEYEALLASVRDNNHQKEQALKESGLKIRRLEEQLMMLKNADADKEYRLKELEYSKRALEQEGDNLRLQINETCSSPTIAIETEKISKHYMQMINSLREEKDKEIQKLRAQISSSRSDSLSKEGNSREFQMKIIELTSSLQRTELLVKKQQEELFRLRQERESKGGVTKAIITKKYRNQYPILGLLHDYNGTSPIKDTQTIVIERTGEMWKQVTQRNWVLTPLFTGILYHTLKNCLLLSGMNASTGENGRSKKCTTQ